MASACVKAHLSGLLAERAEKALNRLSSCDLCPRRCGVNRLEGEKGFCRTGRYALVSSYNLHFGEEDALVGGGGSGTIFFSGCNLGCVFCQNYEISHELEGAIEADSPFLAAMMLSLQEKGAENINFVTPTHVLPQILEALLVAVKGGLDIPLVYNTGSYDLVESLRLLDGIVDVYLPDAKFFTGEIAGRYAGAADYPEVAMMALKEMHRQVGDMRLGGRGTAERGLMIRHLVMPGEAAGTPGWMRFIAGEISKRTFVNIMDQYRPCGEAYKYAELSRGVSAEEYGKALDNARSCGLDNLDDRRRKQVYRLFRLLSDS